VRCLPYGTQLISSHLTVLRVNRRKQRGCDFNRGILHCTTPQITLPTSNRCRSASTYLPSPAPPSPPAARLAHPSRVVTKEKGAVSVVPPPSTVLVLLVVCRPCILHPSPCRAATTLPYHTHLGIALHIRARDTLLSLNGRTGRHLVFPPSFFSSRRDFFQTARRPRSRSRLCGGETAAKLRLGLHCGFCGVGGRCALHGV
jgi:hypothetical protein